MAPRRRKSPTSDIAHDAEMRLDASQDKREPTFEAPPPAAAEPDPNPAEGHASAKEAPAGETPVTDAPAIQAGPGPEPAPMAASEPAPATGSPTTAEPAPPVAATPEPAAPRVETARPLAGDRRVPEERRGRGKILALTGLVLVAGTAALAWSGALAPILPSSPSGGANPPPRISEAPSTPRVITIEPRPVERPSGEAALADELRALKDTVARTDGEVARRLDEIAKDVARVEKDQKAQIDALTARLAAAEQKLATASGAEAARTSSLDGSPGDPAASAPADTEAGGQEEAAAPPIPLPRPNDLSTAAAPRAPAEAVPPGARTNPQTPVLRSWVVRDVYGGVALLEGRYGVFEVVEGSVMPGGGVVESIRRAGGRWVVVTDRGIIAEAR